MHGYWKLMYIIAVTKHERQGVSNHGNSNLICSVEQKWISELWINGKRLPHKGFLTIARASHVEGVPMLLHHRICAKHTKFADNIMRW